ncbi:MAG TPA: NAD(P)H-dependent oxidoreductase [Candidatus Saccharimonadales bacterium]|nr:NAD(P)H-dependent oxidoreductase [Candidatus Saccharimonadales bacterium]
MNILIVYAHNEPSSFTAAMKNLATEVLARQGHTVTISDLYGSGFNPSAQKWDFVTTSGGHFNYMLEQKHAAGLGNAFAPDISAEINKVQVADFVIFVAPLWWHSVPAILKGWFDRVLAMGFAWDGGQFYEKGLLRGKQAMLVVSVGHPAEYYQSTSEHKASINQFLHPINYGTLAFCGFNVHEPFAAMNVLGMDDAAREQALKEFQFRIEHFLDSPNWLVQFSA